MIIHSSKSVLIKENHGQLGKILAQQHNDHGHEVYFVTKSKRIQYHVRVIISIQSKYYFLFFFSLN